MAGSDPRLTEPQQKIFDLVRRRRRSARQVSAALRADGYRWPNALHSDPHYDRCHSTLLALERKELVERVPGAVPVLFRAVEA